MAQLPRVPLLLAMTALGLGACERPPPAPETAAALAAAETRPQAAAPTRLSGGRASLEDLAREVLRCLRAQDADGLHALRITRDEYLELLFPEFDEAKRPSTIPPEFHWKLMDLNSRKGLRGVLSEFGGTDFELLRIEVGDLRGYARCRLHNKVLLHLRKRSDGTTGVEELFGSVVERDGRFKLLSFKD
jgi:hypothetical protein